MSLVNIHQRLSDVPSYPGFYIRVMVMADMVDREHGAIFLRMSSFRPKAREICRSLRWHAQYHYSGALVVVNQGPEFAARVPKGPFCYDIFSRFRVTLRGTRVDECFWEELGNTIAKWIAGQ